MKIKPLGSNQTEIVVGKRHVLFSYETPVAFYDDVGGERLFFVTKQKFNRTTSKHISKWIGNGEFIEVPHEQVEEAI